MRLCEEVAKHLPLRRKHTGPIMDDYAFMCICVRAQRPLIGTHKGHQCQGGVRT